MVKQNCEIEIKRRREKDPIDRSRSRSVRKRRNFAMQSAIYATKAKVGVKCGRDGEGGVEMRTEGTGTKYMYMYLKPEHIRNGTVVVFLLCLSNSWRP